MRPLCIDLFCGLFGWGEVFAERGYDVVGFDLEDMRANFGFPRIPHCNLVIQDVRTLHGSQFRRAACIVASPPCQEYSWMAMPWSKAKAKRAAILADTTGVARAKLTELFDACFRIQREACEAAGHHIPLIVENVRGANEWVGRSRWAFGSFHLWGDVPALMPPTFKGAKVPGFRFDGSGGSFQTASVEESGVKARGMNWSDQSKRGQDFTCIAGWQRSEGTKQGGGFDGDARKGGKGGTSASFGSKSAARKQASAMIAKIPYPLAKHIAETFKPQIAEVA